MTHRRVVADALEYDYLPDDAPLLAHRDWAIASAQLVDDIAGVPLASPFRVRVVLPGTADETAQDGVRVRRIERGIIVTSGADGTFALIARPWHRFTPFAAPIGPTVVVEAEGFGALLHTFPVVYDQRTVAAPPPGAGARIVTLNSNAGLAIGQTLLFGPAATPQYVRIGAIGAANQVTLQGGLLAAHLVGDPVFPDAFTPPPPVLLSMRRASVQIVGRVVTRNTASNVSTPVVNASVAVTDFWRTRAAVVANPTNGAMTDPTPGLRQFVVAVAPGALAGRAAGASVGSLGLPRVAGDDRLLEHPAAAGGVDVEVTTPQNLLPTPAPLPNRLILIDPDDPDAAEFQTIATMQPVGGPAEPARLGLELPLRRSHREGARAARINAPLVLPATTQVLRDAAAPGDRCLFLDGLGGLPPLPLPPDEALRLTGGGAVDEFQRYTQLVVRSDGGGYFRLPPLQRIARVAVTIDDGAGNVQTIETDPAYGEPEHRLDVAYLV